MLEKQVTGRRWWVLCVCDCGSAVLSYYFLEWDFLCWLCRTNYCCEESWEEIRERSKEDIKVFVQKAKAMNGRRRERWTERVGRGEGRGERRGEGRGEVECWVLGCCLLLGERRREGAEIIGPSPPRRRLQCLLRFWPGWFYSNRITSGSLEASICKKKRAWIGTVRPVLQSCNPNYFLFLFWISAEGNCVWKAKRE